MATLETRATRQQEGRRIVLLGGDGRIIDIPGDADPRMVTASLQSIVGNVRRPVHVAIACGDRLPATLSADPAALQGQPSDMEISEISQPQPSLGTDESGGQGHPLGRPRREA